MIKSSKHFTLIMTALLATLLQPPGYAAEYPDPARWDYTMIGFKLQDEISGIKKGGIVATGSSSMRFWDDRIHDDLAPLTITSRGFGGSNMNDLYHHLDRLVLVHEPRAVVIYEGDNDVSQDVPAEVIVATFRGTLTKIHQTLPNTRIYLVSVKPSISRQSMWPEMLKVNKGLQAIAKKDNRVTYIDVATPMFAQDGTMKTDIYIDDQLHLNQKGYDIWSNAIAPVLLQQEVQYEFPRHTGSED